MEKGPRFSCSGCQRGSGGKKEVVTVGLLVVVVQVDCPVGWTPGPSTLGAVSSDRPRPCCQDTVTGSACRSRRRTTAEPSNATTGTRHRQRQRATSTGAESSRPSTAGCGAAPELVQPGLVAVGELGAVTAKQRRCRCDEPAARPGLRFGERPFGKAQRANHGLAHFGAVRAVRAGVKGGQRLLR
jgi:hypothetical protein